MCIERCRFLNIFAAIYCVVFSFCVVSKVRRKTLPLRGENTNIKRMTMIMLFSLEDGFLHILSPSCVRKASNKYMWLMATFQCCTCDELQNNTYQEASHILLFLVSLIFLSSALQHSSQYFKYHCRCQLSRKTSRCKRKNNIRLVTAV